MFNKIVSFLADHRGEITYISPNIEELIGYTPRQIQEDRPVAYGGATFVAIIAEEKERTEPLTARFQGAEIRHAETGELVPVHFLAFFLRNNDGQLVTIAGMAVRPPRLLYLWHLLSKDAQEVVVGLMQALAAQ